MSITDMIRSKRYAPGKGVIGPPPEKGMMRFYFLLINHFWKYVTLNLLFVVFGIPVVTIPAALCGMNRVHIKLIREGNCFLWSEFIKEFKINLLKSLPFGLLFIAQLFVSYYALGISIFSTDNSIKLFAGALGLFILFFALLFYSYVFVFLPSLALKNRHIAKNAFIIMMTEWKSNFKIIISLVVMAFIIAAFFPYSVILLPFIWISLQQLIICFVINETMQKRIIGPYEQQIEKGM